MTDIEAEFISVTKPRRQSHTQRQMNQPVNQPVNLSFADLVAIVHSKLIIYKSSIIGAFIYGSRARGTNRPNSDADIIVFWRHAYDVEFLKSVRASIEEELGFKIDFVSCVHTKKWVDYNDGRDMAYFENIIIDAKPVFGSDSINSLINQSIKLPKLSH